MVIIRQLVNLEAMHQMVNVEVIIASWSYLRPLAVQLITVEVILMSDGRL